MGDTNKKYYTKKTKQNASPLLSLAGCLSDADAEIILRSIKNDKLSKQDDIEHKI